MVCKSGNRTTFALNDLRIPEKFEVIIRGRSQSCKSSTSVFDKDLRNELKLRHKRVNMVCRGDSGQMAWGKTGNEVIVRGRSHKSKSDIWVILGSEYGV